MPPLDVHTPPPAGARPGRVHVVLVNWNGWALTRECLESLLRSDHPDFQVVVCDNASHDGSVERLVAWAEGREPFVPGAACPLPLAPLAKPIAHVVLDRAVAEAGGTAACDDARLVLVRAGGNLGFAGGSNVGLRYALARGTAYAWLLNNDTVVEPGAMRALVERLQARPDAGQCGSTLRYYAQPARVQAWGGTHLAMPEAVGEPVRLDAPPATEAELRAVEDSFGYVEGASIMVTRRFLDEVGLLSEAYFLYYEEPDWAMRARGRFAMAWAPGSVVYHHQGATTAGHALEARRSALTEYYMLRSRLRFTWRHNRRALPWLWRRSWRDVARLARERRPRVMLRCARALLSPSTLLGSGR